MDNQQTLLTLLEQSNGNSLQTIVNKLIVFYFQRNYQGHESPVVLQLYTVRIWWELMIFLATNKEKFKTDKKVLRHVYNLFPRIISQEKTRTYEYRRYIYWKWLSNETSESNTILDYFREHFGLNEKTEVKKLLGLL